MVTIQEMSPEKFQFEKTPKRIWNTNTFESVIFNVKDNQPVKASGKAILEDEFVTFLECLSYNTFEKIIYETTDVLEILIHKSISKIISMVV